ncbi:hypothetical protein OPV22_019140 [Ensete ventricosum]|uniref:Uncharacterized protein n=1 Tax=Ensete ventricosum TaxID=4639 RepID=A0AAV8PGX6_ENSVE|nr:hypothetical protein OPV22_019140 [Ensete ventricosum]
MDPTTILAHKTTASIGAPPPYRCRDPSRGFAAAAALLRQICGRQNEREREREVAEMFELFVLGCTGVVVFLHSAIFFFRALCHRRLTARPLSFLGVGWW